MSYALVLILLSLANVDAENKKWNDICQYCWVAEMWKPKEECNTSYTLILLVVFGIIFCLGLWWVLVWYLRLYENTNKFKKAFKSHTSIDFDQFQVPVEIKDNMKWTDAPHNTNKISNCEFVPSEGNSTGVTYIGRNLVLSKLYMPIDALWIKKRW